MEAQDDPSDLQNRSVAGVVVEIQPFIVYTQSIISLPIAHT